MRKRWFASDLHLMSDNDEDYHLLKKVDEILDSLGIVSDYTGGETIERLVRKGGKRFDTKIGNRIVTTIIDAPNKIEWRNTLIFNLEDKRDEEFLQPFEKIAKQKGAKCFDEIVDDKISTIIKVPHGKSHAEYVFRKVNGSDTIDKRARAVEIRLGKAAFQYREKNKEKNKTYNLWK